MGKFLPFNDHDWEEFSGAIQFDDNQDSGPEPLIMRGQYVAAVIDKQSIQVINDDGFEEFRLELPQNYMRIIREVAVAMSKMEEDEG